MRAAAARLHFIVVATFCGLLLSLAVTDVGIAAAPGASIVAYLQERLGLNEVQVRGALGAMLVFARDRLPKPEFDELTSRIPNADAMMQDVKLRGIVTGPLDDIDEYQQSLATLGLAEPLAAQFAPAVLDYLGAAGYSHERDTLYRVIH
jgi:hypothetical protein